MVVARPPAAGSSTAHLRPGSRHTRGDRRAALPPRPMRPRHGSDLAWRAGSRWSRSNELDVAVDGDHEPTNDREGGDAQRNGYWALHRADAVGVTRRAGRTVRHRLRAPPFTPPVVARCSAPPKGRRRSAGAVRWAAGYQGCTTNGERVALSATLGNVTTASVRPVGRALKLGVSCFFDLGEGTLGNVSAPPWPQLRLRRSPGFRRGPSSRARSRRPRRWPQRARRNGGRCCRLACGGSAATWAAIGLVWGIPRGPRRHRWNVPSSIPTHCVRRRGGRVGWGREDSMTTNPDQERHGRCWATTSGAPRSTR